ncbi:cationic peroxidase 1-like [Phalaenopsis equestris]|uniref:cationic peroxidase 1-like n=1 Tax=Phalaenopsis equestris TaxID=78828 RepID=UPI0009E2A723|nr:cationic peroxidase 1-like [Phalaenopsis equestris]
MANSFSLTTFSSSSSLFIALLLIFSAAASAQLSSTFYSTSCPNALSTIQAAVQSAVANEKRMGASLLRLHFHDCFVQGCDGSVLLDDTSSFTGEKTAGPNQNSIRGFDVVDNIKKQVEAICNQTVSCADILAVAARDSVVALGGPSWTVQLGRRDSTTASLSQANSDIPSPNSNLSALISAFSKKGLSTNDMVALSGAHTIGQARCTVFRTRVYNETNIDASFATSVQGNCPSTGGDNNLSPLDLQTPTTFDNDYYTNLVNKKGLMHSDQQLFNGGSTDSLVNTYSTNPSRFTSDFVTAIVNMGNISPLTGTQGEIRLNCRKTN